MRPELSLSPTKASRKQAVLEGVKRHFAERGAPPSFRELAAMLGTNPRRIKDAVDALIGEGALLHTGAEHHFIALPTAADMMSVGDALIALARAGYIINPESGPLATLAVPNAVTHATLPLLAKLTHIPDAEAAAGGMRENEGEDSSDSGDGGSDAGPSA